MNREIWRALRALAVAILFGASPAWSSAVDQNVSAELIDARRLFLTGKYAEAEEGLHEAKVAAPD